MRNDSPWVGLTPEEDDASWLEEDMRREYDADECDDEDEDGDEE